MNCLFIFRCELLAILRRKDTELNFNNVKNDGKKTFKFIITCNTWRISCAKNIQELHYF